MRSTPFRAVVTAAAVFAALVLFAPAARAYQASAVVTGEQASSPLPASFLGLALEFNTVPQWVGAGTGAAPVDPVLLQLIRNLTPNGRPSIRIGGQSTDRSWWPVPGMKRPIGLTYNLTPAWTTSAHALAQALNAQYLLGINLEANNTRISQTEAVQLTQLIGAQYIQALQVGNEPDLYRFTPWYRIIDGKPAPWYAHTGTPIYSRPASWGPAEYEQQLRQTLAAMPPGPISGPEADTVTNDDWINAFTAQGSTRTPIAMYTSHAYGLNNCVRIASDYRYPTVPNLLKLSASRNLLAGISDDITAAHQHRASFRIDEMGSVTCNGRAGVSNTMASGLWLLDALFTVARADVDGVNLHSYPNSANGLFDLAETGHGWQASVHPLYYGALMFAQASPPGSRQLRVAAPTDAGERVWATVGADDRVRVLVINDSLTSGAAIAVHAPPGFTSQPGALERLRASSAYATGGVSLGGRSFGPATGTGTIAPAVPQSVAPHGGSYSVTLPPASAALLTLNR